MMNSTSFANVWLVESTDLSSEDICETRLCKILRFVYITHLYLALEQSHKHILNVPHQSLLVPLSNAIALILASTITLVFSSA